MPNVNVYVDVQGNFYRSDYPFSISDALVPNVAPAFYAFLGTARKPNASQRRLVVTDNEFTGGVNIRNGQYSATPAFRAAARELRKYGGELIVPPGDYMFTGTVQYFPGFKVSAPLGSVRIFRSDWSQWEPDLDDFLTRDCFFAFYKEYMEFDNGDVMTIVDADCSFNGITFDYLDTSVYPTQGASHAIRCLSGRRVIVDGCKFLYGSDAVAFLHCDQTVIRNCFGIGVRNCFWDHWCSPSNAAVINCESDTSLIAQCSNFNPENSVLLNNYLGITNNGNIAQGFIFVNNRVGCTEAEAGPCQFECLTNNNTSVRKMLIANNRFQNGWLVCRGDTADVTISDNIFEEPQGGTAAIMIYPYLGVPSPSGFKITNNQIINPTTSNVFGVIRCQALESEVKDNRIYGSTYGAFNGIYTTEAVTIVAGNYISNGAQSTPGSVSTTADFIITTDKALRFRYPTDGSELMRFYSDGGKTINMAILDAALAYRNLWTIISQNNTSELQWNIETKINNRFYFSPIALSAEGTTIGTGATPFTNRMFAFINNVVAGVREAVVLPFNTGGGGLYGLLNRGGAALNLFPPNTGSAEINYGGASVPISVADGAGVLVYAFEQGKFVVIATF